MQYFETRSDNQGQKSLDRLSLVSFIHPFTVLTLIFCLFSSGIVTPNPCIQMQFPLPTPCFNVALNSGVRASAIWINIENGERGKSLVITPQWSNTFGPDCSSHLQLGKKMKMSCDLDQFDNCFYVAHLFNAGIFSY